MRHPRRLSPDDDASDRCGYTGVAGHPRCHCYRFATVGDYGDVLDAATDLEVYGYDASFLTQLKPVVPDVAVIARSEADVIAVMRYADEHRIPVTPRGPPVGAVAGVLRCEAGLSLP